MPELPPAGLWPLPDELIQKFGKRNAGPLRAYHFLRECVVRAYAFSEAELKTATGWTGDTPQTYLGKQWRPLVSKNAASQRYSVKPEMARMSLRSFLRNFTQVRLVAPEYRRKVYLAIVTYEFLLPLSREQELTNSLDSLFYRDAVEQRIREIGLVDLRKICPPSGDESDEVYVDRLIDIISSMFVGYSSIHIAGRFRMTPELLSRMDAGDMLSTGERYLLDETTASVRFIVRCPSSARGFSSAPGSASSAVSEKDASFLRAFDISQELEQIRELFFAFFVEAITTSVRGEDEIWLIETSPLGEALYVWEATGD